MLKYRKIYFTISALLVSASIASLLIFGLNLGIDFTGGSLLEIETRNQESTSIDIEQTIEEYEENLFGDVRVQPTENGFLIRLRDISEQEHQQILSIINKQANNNRAIEQLNNIKEIRFETIGPVIGKELKRKALWQIALVAIGIVLYIAYAFRKVSKLKKGSKISWKFGIAALITLLHDVIITLGIFALLGKIFAVEIDNSFIAAILLVLGYSVNDTIVVFDRVRENLIKNKYSSDLEGIINKSISETVVRSLNTSTTTLIVLFSVLLFGGETIFYFVLALIVGIAIGTYSSIFLASPLLYEWEK